MRRSLETSTQFLTRVFSPAHSFLFILVLLTVLLFGAPAEAQLVLDVDRTDDDPAATACTAAPNDCSLRGAIITANANAGSTINLQAAIPYVLDEVTNCENAAADGDLDITADLTIAGNGATIDGADVDRVFHLPLDGSFTVTMSNLTITNGTAQTDSDGCQPGNGGGVLIEQGNTLNLNNVQVSFNEAVAGGGIANDGTLSILDSIIISNTATGDFSDVEGGGGIYQTDNGAMVITRTTISGNTAVAAGGGILDFDGAGDSESTRIVESTISGNTADAGGGIYTNVGSASGIITLINSTLSTNHAIGGDNPPDTGAGGGILVCYGTVNLRNVTVTNNDALEDGGGVALPVCGDGALNVRNTIVAANTSAAATPTPDCFFGGDPGVMTSESFNLIGDETGCDGIFTAATNDQFGTAATPLPPGLGGLAPNGGRTQTHALLPTSPAVDTANTAGCFSDDAGTGGLLTTDQRGTAFPRPRDGGPVGPTPLVCDIGAFELGGCGDGIVDSPTETCDDGNTVGGDGCSATCLLESCGNGTVDVGEQCDPQSTATPCATGLTCNPTTCQCTGCGNGILEAGEECDPPNGTTCDATCQLLAVCGNGILEVGEECDDGNLDNNDACSSLCLILCVAEGSGCGDSGPNICSNNGGLGLGGGASLIPAGLPSGVMIQWLAAFAIPGSVFTALKLKRRNK